MSGCFHAAQVNHILLKVIFNPVAQPTVIAFGETLQHVPEAATDEPLPH
jgi:hypothetical protein